MSAICQKKVVLDSNCCLFWVKECAVSALFFSLSLQVIKSNARPFSKRASQLSCCHREWFVKRCSEIAAWHHQKGFLSIFLVKRWRVVDTSGTCVTSMSLRACQRRWDGILLKVGHPRCFFTTISHEWISLECIIWRFKGNTDSDVCLKMFYLWQSN